VTLEKDLCLGKENVRFQTEYLVQSRKKGLEGLIAFVHVMSVRALG